MDQSMEPAPPPNPHQALADSFLALAKALKNGNPPPIGEAKSLFGSFRAAGMERHIQRMVIEARADLENGRFPEIDLLTSLAKALLPPPKRRIRRTKPATVVTPPAIPTRITDSDFEILEGVNGKVDEIEKRIAERRAILSEYRTAAVTTTTEPTSSFGEADVQWLFRAIEEIEYLDMPTHAELIGALYDIAERMQTWLTKKD